MWRGVYPAICTPFTSEGAVDLEAQRRVVRFALDCGSHGIVAFGLAGEVLKLSADERRALTDVIRRRGGRRSVPVLIGAGAPSIRASVELAHHAEQAGASCIVLPAPMGGSVGEAALRRLLRPCRVFGVGPVMIQDAPAYLGVGLGPELVHRIGAAAENVRLVKLEAGPVEIGDWIVRLGDEFAIWGGDGGVYLLDCVRSGAAGIVPGGDLVDRLVEVYEADARGESSVAEERFREILPRARLRDAALDRPLQHVRKARPRAARRARDRRPASARRDVRRRVARPARTASRRLRDSQRAVCVSTERRQHGGEGLQEPQRLSRQLSTLLAAEIVSGRIGVGEPFASSEEIVNQFSVSRTVARETVQALAMLGMVNVQHGKRTEVRPPEEWDILSSVVQEAMRREGKAEPLLRDLYEFRLLIEPQAAGWMAEYADADETRRAHGTRRPDGGISSATTLPSLDLMEADRSFHDLVSRASDNHVVAAVSRDIREVIGTLWGFSAMDAAAAAPVAEQHQLIAGRRRPPRCVRGRRGHARASPLGSAGGPARARRTVRAAPLLRDEDRLDMALVIGIDTGGTFTDMVVLDTATGRIDSLKTSSMPSTPGQAIVNALDEGGVAAGRDREVYARDDGRARTR